MQISQRKISTPTQQSSKLLVMFLMILVAEK
jgi:hypothetical protein